MCHIFLKNNFSLFIMILRLFIKSVKFLIIKIIVYITILTV